MSPPWCRQGAGRLVASVLLLCGVACRATGEEVSKPALTFFAAASTSDAVRALAVAFEKDHAARVLCNFASSATLAQQIRAGAHADLFLSAHPEWVDLLEKEGRVECRTDLIGNRMVIVVPDASPISTLTPEDLLSPEYRLISSGNPDSVPAGGYARKALVRLGLWEALLPKMVTAVDVRQALAYVESGEVDAGFVYSTDAAISSRVRVVSRVSSDLTGNIRYPLVLLAGHAPAALELLEFTGSDWSKDNFRRLGFDVIAP